MLKSRLKLLRVAIVLAIFATIAATQAQSTPSPANPNANATARAILNYAYGLTNRSDNRVISGQFGSYGDGTTYATAQQQLQAVYDKSGHWPALTGMDCATPAGMNEVVRFLTDKWNEGYLVTLSCHFRNPWTGGSSTDWGNPATSDPWDRRSVRELTIPGSGGYNNWIAILDNLAAHLQTLEDRGVVVIWRPLHELNGTWFWWGGQSPADFTALWRHMFDYFTRVKGLDNLLWVYSPNSGIEAVANYPGGDVVDMVGLDEYSNLNENPLQINSAGEYDALVATGKPVGLFEFGPIPATGAGWDSTNYNWGNLIRDIKERYPRIFVVQAWEYVWQMGYARYQGQNTFMNDPWVITRPDLPQWSTLSGTATTVPPTNAVTHTPTQIMPSATTPPTLPPAGSRVTNGLQTLYTFGESSGSIVRDTSGAALPVNLTISNPANTRWLSGGGLAITGSTIINSGGAPLNLMNALMLTDEISVEAWIRPANTTQSNGARVVTLSNDTTRRNFMIGQNGTSYEGRLRHSVSSDGNGTSVTSPATTATTGLQHVIFTRDAAGSTKLYINGVLQTTATLSGTLDNFNTVLTLNLANEMTGDRPWLGELHLVAVYNRALSQTEITQNVSAGIHGMTIGTTTPTQVPTTAVPTSVPTTAVPTQPPTTVAPTSAPPTTAPPQNGVVQSDSASVSRTTGWASITAPSANGGSYLINSSALDTMDFTFTGVGVDIVYTGGAYGTFRIEIDGAVIRTVSTTRTNGTIRFNDSVRVSGLTNGAHQLRIVPVNSVVAIDAFIPVTGSTAAAVVAPMTEVIVESAPAVVPPAEAQPAADAGLPVASPVPLSLTAGTYESDNASVMQTWGWSPVSNAAASGGSALMSGDSADSLTIVFQGSSITTLYAGNAGTGMMALEIDGQIVQEVDTNSAADTYALAATVSGLTPSIHTLRVLPLNGAPIIVDAFIIDGAVQTAPAVATDIPAELPPVMPTEAPTIASPAALSFDNMEAGTVNWMTAGGWQLARDDMNAAAGYFWQTVTPDSSEDALTWLTPFDFTNVARPLVSFQSWLQAPNSLAWVEVSTDGVNWQQVTTVTPSEAWTNATVDLAAFAGQPRVNVRFNWQQGTSTEGAVNAWRIDDVALINAQ